MHVKTGDKVKVITGKDKGKEGVILKTFPKKIVLLSKALILSRNIAKLPKQTQQVEFLKKQHLSMFLTLC